jgi:hypothetical protein
MKAVAFSTVCHPLTRVRWDLVRSLWCSGYQNIQKHQNTFPIFQIFPNSKMANLGGFQGIVDQLGLDWWQ